MVQPAENMMNKQQPKKDNAADELSKILSESEIVKELLANRIIELQ